MSILPMKIIKVSALNPAQKEFVCSLWNTEYPQKLAMTSQGLDEFLQVQTNQTHFLIQDDAGQVTGWAFTFDRDKERWFAMIIKGTHQRHGLGHLLLNMIKVKETSLNGWVIDHQNDLKQNGEPYLSPLPFYVKNGFIPQPGIRYEDGKISAVKIEWHK
jgi:hypothetical protein